MELSQHAQLGTLASSNTKRSPVQAKRHGMAYLVTRAIVRLTVALACAVAPIALAIGASALGDLLAGRY